MRHVSNSADNLVLLGEMVEMAAGYADQVEQNAAHEDAFMVRLAHDQISYLRKRLSKLDDKLKLLSNLLGSKIRHEPRSREKWGNEEAPVHDAGVGLSQISH
jgi:hypothetical protein